MPAPVFAIPGSAQPRRCGVPRNDAGRGSRGRRGPSRILDSLLRTPPSAEPPKTLGLFLAVPVAPARRRMKCCFICATGTIQGRIRGGITRNNHGDNSQHSSLNYDKTRKALPKSIQITKVVDSQEFSSPKPNEKCCHWWRSTSFAYRATATNSSSKPSNSPKSLSRHTADGTWAPRQTLRRSHSRANATKGLNLER